MTTKTLKLAGIGATAVAAIGTGAVPAASASTTHKKTTHKKSTHHKATQHKAKGKANQKAGASKVYAGSTAQTMWGPVGVKITVAGKKMTAIAISAGPHTQLSYQLQSQSLPILRSEALKSQSYKINGVSGATITSMGFDQSLYSAMKKAHLV